MDEHKILLLTVKELQSVLHIGRDKAYALMHSKGGFPSMKMNGTYYVSVTALEKWLKAYEGKEYII